MAISSTPTPPPVLHEQWDTEGHFWLGRMRVQDTARQQQSAVEKTGAGRKQTQLVYVTVLASFLLPGLGLKHNSCSTCSD